MNGSVRIGSLQPHHRSHLEEIVRATGVFSPEEVDIALELFDEGVTSPTISGDYEFIGAFDGQNQLIGYACFGPTPATDRTFDLYWIAVHPLSQRSGAGALLMSEVERLLETRRARLLVVETSSRDDYAPTRSFYNKHGYEEAARLRDFYAPGDDRVVLTKRVMQSAPPPAS